MPKFTLFHRLRSVDELEEKEALQPTTGEYLSRFKEFSTDCFRNAFEIDSSVPRTDATGALSSSLTEDVVSLCYLQWEALCDYCATSTRLADNSHDDEQEHELVCAGMRHVILTIRNMHYSKLPLLWTTLEGCCRAANDLFRIADKLEVLWCKLCVRHPMLQTPSTRNLMDNDCAANPAVTTLAEEWSDLVRILSCDAVASAERAQVFAMRHVNHNTSIGVDFFSSPWERDLTDNQVMLRLIQLVDGYLDKLKRYLANEHLWSKALVAMCKAVVCFYVRCLVEKADIVSRRRRNERRGLARFGSDRKSFSHAERALRRMWDDVSMLRDFFLQRADGNSALTRMLSNELHILELIHECLDAEDAASIESFVVVIHKRIGADALVTRYFLSDLWLLVAHKPGKQQIEQTLSVLQSDLQLVSNRIHEQSSVTDTIARSDVSFVRLDDMLRIMYEDRIAQGMLLPCWTCVPKIEMEDSKVAVDGIRIIARKLVDLRRKKVFG